MGHREQRGPRRQEERLRPRQGDRQKPGRQGRTAAGPPRRARPRGRRAKARRARRPEVAPKRSRRRRPPRRYCKEDRKSERADRATRHRRPTATIQGSRLGPTLSSAGRERPGTPGRRKAEGHDSRRVLRDGWPSSVSAVPGVLVLAGRLWATATASRTAYGVPRAAVLRCPWGPGQPERHRTTEAQRPPRRSGPGDSSRLTTSSNSPDVRCGRRVSLCGLPTRPTVRAPRAAEYRSPWQPARGAATPIRLLP